MSLQMDISSLSNLSHIPSVWRICLLRARRALMNSYHLQDSCPSGTQEMIDTSLKLDTSQLSRLSPCMFRAKRPLTHSVISHRVNALLALKTHTIFKDFVNLDIARGYKHISMRNRNKPLWSPAVKLVKPLTFLWILLMNGPYINYQGQLFITAPLPMAL